LQSRQHRVVCSRCRTCHLCNVLQHHITETILAGKPVGLGHRFQTISQKEIRNALV
jgi:hypothetical protein